MKTWTLLASISAVLFLAGFSLFAVPPAPVKTPPRLNLTATEVNASDPGRAARRHRQMEQNSWRQYLIR